jgi:8-oxo-dGTP pyrophosphatase MutT (NUDIX family)
MNNLFAISVKGVLSLNDRFLLRQNERTEWELLGGKLEKSDRSCERRLAEEFLEESGVAIKVVRHLEPWLYEIGIRNIIILPFICEPLSVPNALSEEDGASLGWFTDAELETLRIPRGYLCSIRDRKSVV